MRRDASHAREALELLSGVVDDLLPHSCEPRFFPLGQLLSGLPCVPRSTMEKLAAWHREHIDEPDEPTQEDPAPAEVAAPQSTAARGAWLMLAFIAAIVVVALLLK